MSEKTKSLMHEKGFLLIVVAVLTRRLGNYVIISQADIDDVAFSKLNEYELNDGSMRLEVARVGSATKN